MEHDRFIFLEKTYEVMPGEHESDPWTYEEAGNDMDLDCWIKATELKLEPMYSIE